MNNTITLLQPYAYDADAVSLATGLSCPEVTLTQQNTAEETDINFIVQTFARTGILPTNKVAPTYGDFDGVSDYREALELIRQADDAFNSLPAATRAHFSNNPALYLDFIENGSDVDLALKLGIIDKTESPRSSISTSNETQKNLPLD